MDVEGLRGAGGKDLPPESSRLCCCLWAELAGVEMVAGISFKDTVHTHLVGTEVPWLCPTLPDQANIQVRTPT